MTPTSTTSGSGYQPPTSGAQDEIFAADGDPRAHARRLATELAALGPDALADAGRRRDAIFMQQRASRSMRRARTARYVIVRSRSTWCRGS
ncbi:MAG: hypothetical protein PGN13_11290 [Patulibacter minatonensis]